VLIISDTVEFSGAEERHSQFGALYCRRQENVEVKLCSTRFEISSALRGLPEILRHRPEQGLATVEDLYGSVGASREFPPGGEAL